jgi:hypothetical protein
MCPQKSKVLRPKLLTLQVAITYERRFAMLIRYVPVLGVKKEPGAKTYLKMVLLYI